MNRPDVALIMNVANGYWLPLFRLFGIKTAVNVDGIEWEREKWGTLARLIFKGGARLTAKFAEELIFDAKAIEKKWAQRFGVTGQVIAYGGEPATVEVTESTPDRPFVLLVARFVPENTIDAFLEAVPRISRHANVVIVGSASTENDRIAAEVDALATANPRVTWLGHIRDDRMLFALWANSAVYFHGHSVGGTNPALVQAMHCGAAIVARDTIYNREVLGSEAGHFAQPNPDSIYDAITVLLEDEDERGRLKSAALRRANDLYSWGSITGSYRDLVDKLLRKNSSREA